MRDVPTRDWQDAADQPTYLNLTTTSTKNKTTIKAMAPSTSRETHPLIGTAEVPLHARIERRTTLAINVMATAHAMATPFENASSEPINYVTYPSRDHDEIAKRAKEHRQCKQTLQVQRDAKRESRPAVGQ